MLRVENFVKNNVVEISKDSRRFAKKMVNSILQGDYVEMQKLIKESKNFRERVEEEAEIEIDFSREYYYGYLYSYENVARNILDNRRIYNELKETLVNNLDLQKIIMYLDVKEIETYEDIEKYMEKDIEELIDILNEELSLLSIIVSGKNKVCSLNRKGRQAVNLIQLLLKE